MARRELGPASLAAVQAVGHALSETDTHLLVACSGGADSLALAFATGYVAGRSELPYGGVVVDHHLQPGSARVAARVRDQLLALGYDEVSVTSVRVDPEATTGPEAAAREARYEALEAQAREHRATVLLGHTLDDQAETVLLGLVRGSGVRSLAGMAPRVRHLLRPFLRLRRATTAQVCVELSLEPWQDPHNAERRFSRVRVRQAVLPTLETELGPGIAEALARTAALARDDADLLDALAVQAYAGAAQNTLDCAATADQPPALRRRIVRLWLLSHGLTELTMQHISAVDSLLTDWHGQKSIEVPGAVVSRRSGQLNVGER